MMRRWRFGILVLASVCCLAACSSDDASKGDAAKADKKTAAEEKAERKAAEAAKRTPICPQVAIVRGLDVMRDYAGETPDPANLVSAAKLLGVEGDCAYLDNGIDVAFSLDMAAKRGPRLGGLHAGYPFFIAVLDPGGAILNKNQMIADISFSSSEPLASHQESLHVFIPLAKDKDATGPAYRVLAGFQLSADEAAKVGAETPPKP